jgi:hypothetical protein
MEQSTSFRNQQQESIFGKSKGTATQSNGGKASANTSGEANGVLQAPQEALSQSFNLKGDSPCHKH